MTSEIAEHVVNEASDAFYDPDRQEDRKMQTAQENIQSVSLSFAQPSQENLQVELDPVPTDDQLYIQNDLQEKEPEQAQCVSFAAPPEENAGMEVDEEAKQQEPAAEEVQI